MKNILIFADYLPNEGWGGGVIIRSLTKDYPQGIKLFWTTFNTSGANRENTCNGIEILDFQPKYIRGTGISSIILKAEAEKFARSFNKLLAQHQVDLVWIIIGKSYLNLYKVNRLSGKLNVPFHVTVHDDPILEMPENKKLKAKKLFEEVLSRASSIDVISSRMQTHYKQEFNVNSMVITRCIPEDFPENNKIVKDKINILMGGYGNASEPWPLPLLEALENLNKTIPCQIHLFDSKLKKYESSGVKVHDLVDEQSFNAILSTTNIGYACDDLKPENAEFAKLSLPTKVITYIGAGIPFLYHGPLDSTVGDLLKQFETGIIVETNNPHDILRGFFTLVSNYDYYQGNCRLAKQKLFSRKVVQEFFFRNVMQSLN